MNKTIRSLIVGCAVVVPALNAGKGEEYANITRGPGHEYARFGVLRVPLQPVSPEQEREQTEKEKKNGVYANFSLLQLPEEERRLRRHTAKREEGSAEYANFSALQLPEGELRRRQKKLERRQKKLEKGQRKLKEGQETLQRNQEEFERQKELFLIQKISHGDRSKKRFSRAFSSLFLQKDSKDSASGKTCKRSDPHCGQNYSGIREAFSVVSSDKRSSTSKEELWNRLSEFDQLKREIDVFDSQGRPWKELLGLRKRKNSIFDDLSSYEGCSYEGCIDSFNDEGHTPLTFAIDQVRDPKLAEALLKGGADVTTRNRQGASPLYYAIKHGMTGIVKELLQRGAKNANPVLKNKKEFDAAFALLETCRDSMTTGTMQEIFCSLFQFQFSTVK